jgi:spermidine synthase
MSEFKWWHERSDGHGITTSVEVKLLHSEQSPHQHIEIYDHQSFGRLLVLDGYIQASQADEFIYHEMAVHVPLLGRERKDASVLIIGGGDGGILRESLKHDFVTRVTMVEIDQRVIALAKEYLAVNGDYDDPRVTLVIDNAANFVSQALQSGQRYDLIVLDLTEPVGPSSCLFTEKFLTEVVSLVSETGVILDSDSIYLSQSGGDFLQEVSGDGDNLVTVMQRTRLLPHIEVYHTNIPLYPGADFGFFLYSRDGVSLRKPVKAFEGRHYNADVHQAAFALPNWQKKWSSVQD